MTRATAPGCLLAGTSQAIGKRLCGRTVGAGVAPEFMPKRNCGLIRNRGRTVDDAVRLEIGEQQGGVNSNRLVPLRFGRGFLGCWCWPCPVER